MPDAEPPATLSPATVEAILAAAGRSGPVPPELIEKLGRWLDDVLERAIHRVQRQPLTPEDVDKLERAYARFSYIVQALQDRTNPPPVIPTRDCQTDWEHWIATHRALGFRRGPRESIEWQLIGELIVFYETISDRPASAAQPAGLTMTFLTTALGELRSHVPDDLRSNFASPKNGVLRRQLPALKGGYFRFVAQELRTLF